MVMMLSGCGRVHYERASIAAGDAARRPDTSAAGDGGSRDADGGRDDARGNDAMTDVGPQPDVDASTTDADASVADGDATVTDADATFDATPDADGSAPDADARVGACDGSTCMGAPSDLLQIGGTGFDLLRGAATDATGDIYVTGGFSAMADLGAASPTSNGGYDAYVARFDGVARTGQWVHPFGGAGVDVSQAIAVDAAGNSYVTGTFVGPVDFGAGTRTSAGGDTFVLALDPAGAFRWVTTFGGANDVDQGISIAVAAGIVSVTGRFEGTATFGSDIRTASGRDIFVVGLDATTGTIGWSRQIGGTGLDEAGALATDELGAIYVTGSVLCPVDFGAGPIGPAGQPALFLAKYDSAGALTYADVHSGGQGYNIAVGPAQVVVSGRFLGSVTFGSLPMLTTARPFEACAASFDREDGTPTWARRFPGPNASTATAALVDDLDNAFVAVSYDIEIDLGDGARAGAESSTTDIAIGSYGPTGAFRWGRTFTATATQGPAALATLAPGVIGLCGFAHGTIDLGVATLTSRGQSDGFLLWLDD